MRGGRSVSPLSNWALARIGSDALAPKRTAFIRPSVHCEFVSRLSIRRMTMMISGWSDDGGHSCIGS